MHLLLCITSCQITFYNNQSIIFNQDIFRHCKRIQIFFFYRRTFQISQAILNFTDWRIPLFVPLPGYTRRYFCAVCRFELQRPLKYTFRVASTILEVMGLLIRTASSHMSWKVWAISVNRTMESSWSLKLLFLDNLALRCFS